MTDTILNQHPHLIASGDFKAIILIVGMMVSVLGLYLRSKLLAAASERVAGELASGDPGDDQKNHEHRKFGRRISVARMMVLLGISISSCYWVRDGVIFAILLSIMLLLIFGITILAYIDLVSVGLKLGLDHLSKEDRESQLAIEKAIDKHRRAAEDSTVDESEKYRE